ncbi:DUF1802 family protein [Deinococcus peraridilitoris]|uniref:DUF1802 family protein n=1 Tax=Deinococcus peraridilitoris (strain DSM 19664 / LMG 22246 / CIP 109416 / KR-200) TaxID=937777 RepID=L0A1Z2_DEIPD|nr:DUF1802 family protein [Deinococcus peraridilitoris]AFZ67469.1 hypothetical protein Deipe_1966 [Deinococcus peraridilitoris DSM 19664]
MSTSYALKEWDAQVRALLSGEVSLLLRKGGIMETHDGFEVEHRSFLLYPTFLHQNPQELRSEFAPLLRPDPKPGVVTLPALAEVHSVWKIEDLQQALALQELQALNAAAIERRFHYRGRPWLHALLVRVTRLSAPLHLTETPEMLGCVSWVPLDDTPKAHGERVRTDAELQALHDEIERRLAPHG